MLDFLGTVSLPAIQIARERHQRRRMAMSTASKVVVTVLAVIGALALVGLGGMALMHLFMMGGATCC